MVVTTKNRTGVSTTSSAESRTHSSPTSTPLGIAVDSPCHGCADLSRRDTRTIATPHASVPTVQLAAKNPANTTPRRQSRPSASGAGSRAGW